jgi:hypothetical protein
MKRRVVFLVKMLLLASLQTAAPSGAVSQSSLSSHRSPAICASEGRLNLDRAKTLQDEMLRTPPISKEILLSIMIELREGRNFCPNLMTAAGEKILSGLQVLLGERLLAEKEFELAHQTLRIANLMFERSDVPDIMWLRSLELAAQTEIGLQDINDASELAAQATDLARSWVSTREVDKLSLIRALRFQAHVLSLKGDSGRAAALNNEANKLDNRN